MGAWRRPLQDRSGIEKRMASDALHEIAVMEATLMKPIGLIGMGVLLLLSGVFTPTYAQQEETKPPKQEQQAKPENQQPQQKQQQQQANTNKQQQQHAQQQAQQEAKGQQQQQQKQQQANA